MKKMNNRFQRCNNNGGNNNNNYSNSIYSLNYKFDSISPAGKFSGNALDLIKKYNELAKEAHGNSDYVEAEVFRQYAEHYRKIVTEINEKKSQRMALQQQENEAAAAAQTAAAPVTDSQAKSPTAEAVAALVEEAPLAPAPQKREFKVIEITPAESKAELIAPASPAADPEAKPAKAPRTPRRKSLAAAML